MMMSQATGGDTPVGIISDHIRRQGYACEEPRHAERDQPASRPNETVWILRCGDVMPGCDKVIEGKNEDEVFAKAEEHARKEHNMTIILPSTMREIGAAIHDKP